MIDGRLFKRSLPLPKLAVPRELRESIITIVVTMSPFHTIMFLSQSHCGPLDYTFLQSGVYLHLAPPHLRDQNMLPRSEPTTWRSYWDVRLGAGGASDLKAFM
jgi:hypothetical protein